MRLITFCLNPDSFIEAQGHKNNDFLHCNLHDYNSNAGLSKPIPLVVQRI
jgi:hypothetical protein